MSCFTAVLKQHVIVKYRQSYHGCEAWIWRHVLSSLSDISATTLSRASSSPSPPPPPLLLLLFPLLRVRLLLREGGAADRAGAVGRAAGRFGGARLGARWAPAPPPLPLPLPLPLLSLRLLVVLGGAERCCCGLPVLLRPFHVRVRGDGATAGETAAMGLVALFSACDKRWVGSGQVADGSRCNA